MGQGFYPPPAALCNFLGRDPYYITFFTAPAPLNPLTSHFPRFCTVVSSLYELPVCWGVFSPFGFVSYIDPESGASRGAATASFSTDSNRAIYWHECYTRCVSFNSSISSLRSWLLLQLFFLRLIETPTQCGGTYIYLIIIISHCRA